MYLERNNSALFLNPEFWNEEQTLTNHKNEDLAQIVLYSLRVFLIFFFFFLSILSENSAAALSL